MSITVQKILGAVLAALIVAVGIDLSVNAVMPPFVPPASTGGGAAQGAPAAPGGAPATAQGGTPDAPLGERLARASAEKGQAEARKCQSCHGFDEAGASRIGPNLHGVVGRAKASLSGFAYSEALKGLGGSWTREDLDHFLTRPQSFAKGTKMTFAGISDGQDRADLIAYLARISPAAPPPPAAEGGGKTGESPPR